MKMLLNNHRIRFWALIIIPAISGRPIGRIVKYQNIPKFVKIMIFAKISILKKLPEIPLYIEFWLENGLKTIKKRFLTNIWCLDNISSIFSKIEKNRFWKIFFRICINKIGQILIFRPEIGQKNLEIEKSYLSTHSKNFLTTYSDLGRFLP